MILRRPIVFILAVTLLGAAHAGEEALRLLRRGPAAGSAEYERLEAVLQERAAEIKALMRTDPAAVPYRALSDGDRALLPPALEPLVERPAELEGQAVAMVECSLEEGGSLTRTYLEPRSGPSYEVHFRAPRTPWLTGSTVRAEGLLLGEDFLLTADPQDLSPAPVPLLAGERKVLVILIRFADSTGDPTTVETAESAMFSSPTSIRQFYLETSGNRLSLTGDVRGVYTIAARAADGCDTTTWMTQAKAAAQADGVNVAQYQHVQLMFPSAGSACGWLGLGTLGGGQTWVKVSGSPSKMAMGHELGHNFQWHHARSMTCGALAVDNYANCAWSEYGDPTDVMGNSGLFQPNGVHKTAQEWVAGAQIKTVDSKGAHFVTLLPLEPSAPGGAQVLRIPKLNVPQEAYFISYRRPQGAFDTSLNSQFFSGASVHIGGSSLFSYTSLVDTTPGDGNRMNSALTDGAEFHDALNDIRVRQISHTADSVLLEVYLNQGFPDPPAQEKATSYPNPANPARDGPITIEKAFPLSTLEVVSLSGRVLGQIPVDGFGRARWTAMGPDGRPWPSGTYLLIERGSGRKVLKVTLVN